MVTKPGYLRAIGLQYDSCARTVPSISAKGTALVADQIVKLARRYSVPVVEKPSLARALEAQELDTPIPESLFEAVSVLLSELDRRLF